MKIEELYIENFRGVHKLEVKDLAYLNVIAGLNGAGKSSVLTAIKTLLSWLIARIRNQKGNGISIKDKDITNGIGGLVEPFAWGDRGTRTAESF